MPDYDIRPYRAGDEHAILKTFDTVFGEGHDDYEPRSLAEWNWAFRDNPAGRRIWVADCAGQIAAQCAALPFRVRLDGKPATITQGVDSMVHPDHRRGLRRPGLFVATARPFFEEFRGPGKDVLHYGWPVEPAWRIGKTFLGYEIVRTQTVLFQTPGAGPTERPASVEVLERFDEDVLELYERASVNWGLSVLRDATYLNWRYVDHPRFRYTIFGVRGESGKLRGFAVFRKADSPRPDGGIVMDWLVPEDDLEAGELLAAALLAQARAEGAAHLIAAFPDWSAWFERFQVWRWNVYGSDYLLIGIIQNPRYDTWWLRDNWWYQLGELDAI